jgi:uncharacterized protein YecT (DUF1311 family)
MIRIALAFAALLLLVPVAQAASFDCATAGTSFEKAICADPGLSMQDEVLAQAYATALGGLSTGAATEVKTGQKAWLYFAQRACSDEAELIAGPYDEDQTQCLASVFRSRIGALEASRMEGGYRFYPIDRYLVQPDEELNEGDYGYKAAQKEFHTVKIDRDDELATAFNAAIDAISADQGSFFKPGTLDISPDDSTSDYDIRTKVAEVTSHRITLDYNQWWYGHGAAHGNYFITHHHFLTGHKRMLEASDIFSGEGWQDKLIEATVAHLKSDIGEDNLFEDYANNVPDLATIPERWMFSDKGLTIQFNIYEITAYAAGAIEVTIPWEELDGVLADGAQEIAYYY